MPRPKVAQERREPRPDGLVRITLKKAYTDGTVAVDTDPPSLLCRLATRVPAPRLHTVRQARPNGAGRRIPPWAELLARTFAVDVLRCRSCQGRHSVPGLDRPWEALRKAPAHARQGPG